MPYSRYVDRNKILITNIHGVITLDDTIKLLDELPGFAVDDEIYEIIIHDSNALLALDHDDTRTSIENANKALQGFRKAAIAFVSSQDLVFGRCRQLQSHVENDFIHMSVFRAEEDGYQWIARMKSLTWEEATFASHCTK